MRTTSASAEGDTSVVLGGTERLNGLVRRGQEVADDEVRDEKREHEQRRTHGTREKIGYRAGPL
jgi:hypothetical protein